MKKDLEHWHKVFLTWMGRISAIKQNLLPKMLYKISALPISIPKNFFKELRSMIMRFIWELRPARLTFEILRRHRELWGLGVPYLELYPGTS